MELIVIVILKSQVSIVLCICVMIRLSVDASQDDRCNVTCEFTDWALDANCRARGLDYVPHGCVTAVAIDLRNNDLKVIQPGNFTGFRDLRYLDLEFNAIRNIDSGAFGGCDSLLYIYLQFNALVSVDEGAFEGARFLEKLFLNQNDIFDLHQDAFRGLGNLNGLYIGHNDIRQLPEGIFRHTPSLQYLHMGDNSLTSLPQKIFAHLPDLTYLSLTNNDIRVIETGLFDALQNLAELDLSGNRIISISDFPLLPNLKILDLYDNEINQTGDFPEKVEGLDELYLAENKIPCTCSMDPIREWIQVHKSDDDVDADKVNLTCPLPLHFLGKFLDSIPRGDLCPLGVARDSVPTSFPMRTVTNKRLNEYHDSQVQEWSDEYIISELSDTVIYVMVAGITIAVIILVMCILIKYLNRRSLRYQEHLHQEEMKQNRSTHITDDRNPFHPARHDEDIYEHIRPHSPTQDSAFGSQDELSNYDDEVPQHQMASFDTSDRGLSASPEWRGHHPLPQINEISPLARERRSTNPFLSDTLQDDHLAVPMPEEEFISHTETDPMHSTDVPQYTIHVINTPDYNPKGTPQHGTMKIQHVYFDPQNLKSQINQQYTKEVERNHTSKERDKQIHNQMKQFKTTPKTTPKKDEIYNKYNGNTEREPLNCHRDCPTKDDSETDSCHCLDQMYQRNANPLTDNRSSNPFMV